MPNYKLTYFNIRWLGEGARLLFNYAGVPFEDVRITPEQWKELKGKTPFGQVPVLDVDGQKIAQSAAIYRYLGRQFNLTPKSAVEDAMVDAVYDAHKDFHAEIRPFFAVATGFAQGDKVLVAESWSDKKIKQVNVTCTRVTNRKPDLETIKFSNAYFVYQITNSKEGGEKACLKMEKLLKEVLIPARDKYFGYLKKYLMKSDGNHLVGKALTWGDIVIADNLYVIHGLAPPLFDGYPEIKKFADYIHALPDLQKYLKERPMSHV